MFYAVYFDKMWIWIIVYTRHCVTKLYLSAKALQNPVSSTEKNWYFVCFLSMFCDFSFQNWVEIASVCSLYFFASVVVLPSAFWAGCRVFKWCIKPITEECLVVVVPLYIWYGRLFQIACLIYFTETVKWWAAATQTLWTRWKIIK